jgi:glycerol-3-phosphate acyltransferase PlsY
MCDTTLSQILLYLALGYLCGSIPFGLLVGKFSGLGDIRKTGSGNIGATNMLRTGGKKLAVLTLFLDGGKAALPVMLGVSVCFTLGAPAFLGAVLGHMFPVWLKFKGGKGVATTLGGFLALHFPLGALLCGIWLATAVLFRYSSLSALVAVGSAPLLLYALRPDVDILTLSIAGVIAILVFIRHHSNIRRLLKGEEPKIGKK